MGQHLHLRFGASAAGCKTSQRDSSGLESCRAVSAHVIVIRVFSMAALFDGVDGMEDLAEIYEKMEANCPNPKSESEKLWELRCACDIAPHNRSPETLLEKAVAMLAKNGYMDEWSNQCPTASGINDSSRDRHSNVDLVHWPPSEKSTAGRVEVGKQRSALRTKRDSSIRRRIYFLSISPK